MPINIEIMAVTGYCAARDRRRQAERANILCGYEVVAKEQLCPLDLLLCPVFSLKPTSRHSLTLFPYFTHVSLASCVPTMCTTVPPLNCSSSSSVMMGPLVMA